MLQIDPKKMRQAAIIGNAVLTKAIMVIFFGWVGIKLDKHWGTQPWMMILGISLGIGLGLWYVLFTLNRFTDDK